MRVWDLRNLLYLLYYYGCSLIEGLQKLENSLEVQRRSFGFSGLFRRFVDRSKAGPMCPVANIITIAQCLFIS
jgi:hypothetical protein